MKKLIVIIAGLLLAACGGGGSSAPSCTIAFSQPSYTYDTTAMASLGVPLHLNPAGAMCVAAGILTAPPTLVVSGNGPTCVDAKGDGGITILASRDPNTGLFPTGKYTLDASANVSGAVCSATAELLVQ